VSYDIILICYLRRDKDMAVKNRLKVILAEKRIQQNELAQAIGVTKATMSNIINEKQGATLETAFDIAEFLGVKVDDIFYKVKPQENAEEDFIKLLNNIDIIYDMYEKQNLTRDGLIKVAQFFVDEFIKKYGALLIDVYLINLGEGKLDVSINERMLEVFQGIRY
jgi:putative transcriptional regulator